MFKKKINKELIPHIVKFKDGKYAVRRLCNWKDEYEYLDLLNLQYWWHMIEHIDRYSKFKNLKYVEKQLEKYYDKGEPI